MNILIKRTLMSSVRSFFTTPLKFSFAMLEAKPGKKPQVPFQKWTILRGDVVKVIAGKDKGKIGKVTKVWRKQNRITVRGVNLKLKNTRNFISHLRKSIRSHDSQKKSLPHSRLECRFVR